MNTEYLNIKKIIYTELYISINLLENAYIHYLSKINTKHGFKGIDGQINKLSYAQLESSCKKLVEIDDEIYFKFIDKDVREFLPKEKKEILEDKLAQNVLNMSDENKIKFVDKSIDENFPVVRLKFTSDKENNFASKYINEIFKIIYSFVTKRDIKCLKEKYKYCVPKQKTTRVLLKYYKRLGEMEAIDSLIKLFSSRVNRLGVDKFDDDYRYKRKNKCWKLIDKVIEKVESSHSLN